MKSQRDDVVPVSWPPAGVPVDVARGVRSLFEALPLATSMRALVVKEPAGAEHVGRIEALVTDPWLAVRPGLVAGLWLYVDELDRSHRVSQQMPDATGSYWHAIMHRREGDFDNSRYWLGKTGRHAAMALVAAESTYDAREFVGQVEQATGGGASPASLVAMQRAEWVALFTWCAQQ